MKRYIVYWAGQNIAAEPTRFREALLNNNCCWFADMLPELCSPATALERSRRCRPRGNFTFKNLGRDPEGNAHLGFVEENSDPLMDNMAEVYKAEAKFVVSSKKDGTLDFTFVPDIFQQDADKLLNAFQKEAGYLTQPDLGVLFTRVVVNRWRGVRIKPGTALFMTPDSPKDEIDNLNAALSEAKVPVQFIADEVSYADQFAEPIKVSLLSEINDLVAGAEKLQKKADGSKDIRYDTIERRIKKAQDMMTKAKLYKDILKEKDAEVVSAIQSYQSSIMKIMETLANKSRANKGEYHAGQ